MAKSADIRPGITLACTECKERNYITTKNRRNTPDPAVCGTRRIVGDCGTVAPADRRDHGVADRRRSGNDHACRDVCERHG